MSNSTKDTSPAEFLIRWSLNYVYPDINDKLQLNSCRFWLMLCGHHQLLECFFVCVCVFPPHTRIRFFCHGDFGGFFPIENGIRHWNTLSCSILKHFSCGATACPMTHCCELEKCPPFWDGIRKAPLSNSHRSGVLGKHSQVLNLASTARELQRALASWPGSLCSAEFDLPLLVALPSA